MKILTGKEIGEIFELLSYINISVYSKIFDDSNLVHETMRSTAEIARIIGKENELINRNKIIYSYKKL